MDKIVMLNKDNAVIDVVENVKPVCKSRSGITILCSNDEAQGYIGSDEETIYAKYGMQFQPTYYDIAKMYTVNEDDIPSIVRPLVYKYSPEKGFFLNEDSYPDTNKGLTTKTNDLENIVLEMSEIVYA